MEPQNNQNNNNASFKIQPTSGLGISSVQNSSMHTFAEDLKNATAKSGMSQEQEAEKPKEKLGIQPQEKPVIRTLHTYADDINNAVQNDGITMSKIVMEEAKKQEAEKLEEEATSPNSPKNRSIIIISAIMILLAGASAVAVWYFVSNRQKSIAPVVAVHRPSMIPYEEEFPIDLDSTERNKMMDLIESAKKQNYQKDSQIIYLPVTAKNATEKYLINTESLFFVFGARVPSALLRSFDSEFMLGLNKTDLGYSPFMLISAESFSQMYSGMLEWEPAMADDIGDLFFKKEDLVFVEADKIISTSTASSTPKTVTGVATSTVVANVSTTSTSSLSQVEEKEFKSKYIIANSLKFKDEVLNNKDIRVLKTLSNNVLMYYVFINDKILLIARDAQTLDEVVKRLATSQFRQ